MKNLNSFLILAVMGVAVVNSLQPSSTATVSLIGGIIQARHIAEQSDSKYPRDECPVCEGKGWYMSGDGISQVECGYCEPVKQEPTLAEEEEEEELSKDPPLVPIKPDTFILRK